MNRISTMTVFEHQRLMTQDFAWVTDFDWLLKEELAVFTIIRKQGQWQLKVGHYIGIILLPSGIMLEILPKPIIEDDAKNCLVQTRGWVQMMLSALTGSNRSLPNNKNFGHLSPYVAPSATSIPPLSEWLVTQFIQRLAHYQPISRYQTQTGNEALMQGKLVIKEQIRRNGSQPHKFVCEISALSQESIANRLIKSALVLLEPLLGKYTLITVLQMWRGISVLTPHECRQLDWVYEQSKSQLASQPLSLRQRRRAQQLLDLAYWLLKQSNIEAGYGLDAKRASQSNKMRLCLLLDMNQAFEQWASLSIAAMIKAGDPNYEPLYQTQSVWLSDVTGQTQLSMRPDLLIRRKDQAASKTSTSSTTSKINTRAIYSHVIDIKWKAITNAGAMSASDAYQLTSYAQAYQAEHIWLVYPVLGNSRQPMALKQRGDMAFEGKNKVKSVPTGTLWLMPFNVLEGTLNSALVGATG